MTTLPVLDEMKEHLYAVPNKYWAKLFSLIPLIEQVDSPKGWFTPDGFSLKQEAQSVMSLFYSLVYDMGLIINFDWMEWQEGRMLLESESIDYSALTSIQLCKLLTYIVRSDRFSEGFLIFCFKEGEITRTIKALETYYG